MCVFTMFKLVIKHKYMKKDRILEENLWNRLFHCRQLRRQREKVWNARRIISAAYPFLGALEKATSLSPPDPCGMFRTKDILEMKPEEVYLGDLYGLWTKTIPEWEEHRQEKYGANAFGLDPDTPLYQIIMDQYRGHLASNVEAIRDAEKKYLSQFRDE